MYLIEVNYEELTLFKKNQVQGNGILVKVLTDFNKYGPVHTLYYLVQLI